MPQIYTYNGVDYAVGRKVKALKIQYYEGGYVYTYDDVGTIVQKRSAPDTGYVYVVWPRHVANGYDHWMIGVECLELLGDNPLLNTITEGGRL